MAWTSPKTDFGAEVLTSAQMNAIGDNLEYLFSPNSAYFFMDEGSNYSTSSSTFVDVDTTAGKGKLTIDTDGGNVMIIISLATNADLLALDVEVDGVSITGGTDGLNNPEAHYMHTRIFVFEGLSDSSHTFDLLWRTTGTSVTIYAGTTYQSFWGVTRMG